VLLKVKNNTSPRRKLTVKIADKRQVFNGRVAMQTRQ
jgi:hypothetical protein